MISSAAGQRKCCISQESFFVSIDELIGRYVHAQVVYVAAKLGLADLMGDRPRRVEDIAELVEVNPYSLKQVSNSSEQSQRKDAGVSLRQPLSCSS
jgi:hypothetical protein